MRTQFLTSFTTTFSPFSPHSKVPRLILSLLPPTARNHIKIKTQLLPSSAKGVPATLKVAFKDGVEMGWAWEGEEGGKGLGEGGEKGQVRVTDVVEAVERHHRKLKRLEELNG